MKFWEAMKALHEGKKVRLSHWHPDRYLQVIEGIIYTQDGGATNNFNDINLKDKWKIYEEPKKKVYQWRFKQNGEWIVLDTLMTVQEANRHFEYCNNVFTTHAGPFEVEK